jgi:peptidoglycan/LPS O-acetylase OafA/YrhL
LPVRSSVNLGEALRAGRDNFLPLRHLAALMVIYGHSYRLSAHAPGQIDLVERFMPGFYAGSLAVFVFFAISGYLVTAGLIRKPGLWRYVRNRFLRVYPGYLACLLAVVLLLGPAFSTLPIGDYFHAAQTWQYLLTNLSPITLAWKLPGVFEGNPYPGVVNGTLWSLGLEVRWYAYLGLLALLGVASRRWLFTVVALAFLAFASWEISLGKPDPLSFRALSMVFMAGALLAQWRERVRIHHCAGRAIATIPTGCSCTDSRCSSAWRRCCRRCRHWRCSRWLRRSR